jgi:hypothetical protein
MLIQSGSVWSQQPNDPINRDPINCDPIKQRLLYS